jgi:hypothetical protein
MTDDDIRRFQDVFEALLANSDGNGRIPTLFFEAVMLSGLGDLVYLEDVPRRMIARRGMTQNPADVDHFRQSATALATVDAGHSRKTARSGR